MIKIILLPAIAILATGLLLVPKEAPKTEQVAHVTETTAEIVPVTAPEAPQATETVIVTENPVVQETVAVEPVEAPVEYTLADARAYYAQTYPEKSLEVFDKYFVEHPWIIEQQKSLGGWSDGFIDHIVIYSLRFDQARYDNAKK